MPSDERWVGTWAAAPAPAEGVAGFNNQTIRLNPRVSIGGERLRVRISNAYGNRPLAIGAATVALRDKGPAIVAGKSRKLTFGGRDWPSSRPARWRTAMPLMFPFRRSPISQSVSICPAKCWRISR